MLKSAFGANCFQFYLHLEDITHSIVLSATMVAHPFPSAPEDAGCYCESPKWLSSKVEENPILKDQQRGFSYEDFRTEESADSDMGEGLLLFYIKVYHQHYAGDPPAIT